MGAATPFGCWKSMAAPSVTPLSKTSMGKSSKMSNEQAWSFLEALRRFIFTPLGGGVVDIPAVIRTLNSHRYDGWLVIEQDTTPLDPTVIARQNRLYLERLLQSER